MDKMRLDRRLTNSSAPGISLVYIGNVVPDLPEFMTGAASRAGIRFQLELIKSISSAGLSPNLVIAYEPIEAFPRGKRVWIGPRHVTLTGQIGAFLVPFINITPLKQLSIAAAVAIRLIAWRWTTRTSPEHVIYCFNLSVPPGWVVLGVGRLLGTKVVVSLNDINVPGETIDRSAYNRADFLLQRLVLPHFDGYVVVADAIMKDFAPNRDYIRIDGGVGDEQMLAPRQPYPESGFASLPFTLVVTSRLDKTNGILEILEAMEVLKCANVRLYIAGVGPLIDVVKAAAARDERIIYLGLISYDETIRLYQRADVLVNMRLTRALNTKYFFPSKMIEYLTSGIPVITTCTGHVEEEYGAFCYLLKDETGAGLARLIEMVTLKSRGDLREVGRRARAYMCSVKSWEAQGQRIVRYVTGCAAIARGRMY
jgi:glycosyltransferase involved in cell wall biosynthesis